MGLSRKKIENPKIGCVCFFVLQYIELFSTHASSNFSIYMYIYLYNNSHITSNSAIYKYIYITNSITYSVGIYIRTTGCPPNKPGSAGVYNRNLADHPIDQGQLGLC